MHAGVIAGAASLHAILIFYSQAFADIAAE
jgi:hypothetical protein